MKRKSRYPSASPNLSLNKTRHYHHDRPHYDAPSNDRLGRRDRYRHRDDDLDDHWDGDTPKPVTKPASKAPIKIDILALMTRLDVGLASLLLLSLAVGITIGHFMKQNAETELQEARVARAQAEIDNTPRLNFSLNPRTEALKQYYEERITDLPPEKRVNPNAAPVDALAALPAPLLVAQESVPAPDIAADIAPKTKPEPETKPEIQIESALETYEDSITPAPESLQQENPQENLEDAPRWLRYAQHYDLSQDQPMIAIVLDDIGLDKAHTNKAIAIDYPMTLSFLPYATGLTALTDQARNRGHEIMLHLPMEPLSEHIDPGPQAMLTSLTDEALMERLQWNLARFDRYVGINNHMGSRFTGDARLMRPVLEVVKDRGLFFLDSVTTKDSKGYLLAQSMKMPHAVRDIFIDHALNIESIMGQLALIEQTAQRKGFAVAIGHPHDLTLDALNQWLPTLKAKGLAIVPITAIIRKQQNRIAQSQTRPASNQIAAHSIAQQARLDN
ncbi:MAG: divergent polysaccharide deacetylase family protein [Alphaproteobacteria bacterium]